LDQAPLVLAEKPRRQPFTSALTSLHGVRMSVIGSRPGPRQRRKDGFWFVAIGVLSSGSSRVPLPGLRSSLPLAGRRGESRSSHATLKPIVPRQPPARSRVCAGDKLTIQIAAKRSSGSAQAGPRMRSSGPAPLKTRLTPSSGWTSEAGYVRCLHRHGWSNALPCEPESVGRNGWENQGVSAHVAPPSGVRPEVWCRTPPIGLTSGMLRLGRSTPAARVSSHGSATRSTSTLGTWQPAVRSLLMMTTVLPATIFMILWQLRARPMVPGASVVAIGFGSGLTAAAMLFWSR
jgi:hypothetical protein